MDNMQGKRSERNEEVVQIYEKSRLGKLVATSKLDDDRVGIKYPYRYLQSFPN